VTNELKESVMYRAVSVGALILVCIVACTHVRPSLLKAPSATAAAPPPEEPHGSPAASAPDNLAAPVAPAEIAAGSSTAAQPGASAATPSQPTTVVPDVVKPKAPRANLPAKSSAAERSAPGQVGNANAAEKPLASALDFASLEQRLRDTQAIGVFTKLSLKNQVNDLLDEFRDFYSGQTKSSLADLRQRYDLLLLKVLALLQDSDPPLASAISASREAIWGILTDREKFQKI
jgi:hypothetical protein